MATTLVDIKEVYNETIADITSDSRKWQSFLSCASKNYKYDFDEQLLIYAQRPTAVACASYDVWNSKLNRIIKFLFRASLRVAIFLFPLSMLREIS